MFGGRLKGWLAAGSVAALVLAFGLPSISAGRGQHQRRAADCASPDVNTPRDPANPLALPSPPGRDPIQGAHFFVDGPRHGNAAGTVAQLIGVNPTSVSETTSWPDFKAAHQGAINGNYRAREISKIADEQETQNISLFSQGGGRGAIFSQTQKILCNNMAADSTPASVAVFTTFMIYPNGQECPSLSQIRGWQGTFHRLVDEMAAGIGRKRAIILEEIDSIGVSSCLRGRSLAIWLGDLKYESKKLGSLPHTVVYQEAGYSDAQGPAWTANRLWKAGINQIRGFFTNDTHLVWSIDEIRWAQDIADDLYARSHHRYTAHFIVNTAQNGRGPKRNPHPVTQGNEDLCNPPGRGLGRIPTGAVAGLGFRYLDGFLWTGVPGRSHGSSCPNGPWKSAGTFDPRFALELAQNANQQLGPHYPSQPY
jgi:hypothetical protein